MPEREGLTGGVSQIADGRLAERAWGVPKRERERGREGLGIQDPAGATSRNYPSHQGGAACGEVCRCAVSSTKGRGGAWTRLSRRRARTSLVRVTFSTRISWKLLLQKEVSLVGHSPVVGLDSYREQKARVPVLWIVWGRERDEEVSETAAEWGSSPVLFN